jgi:hypothetical protein
MSLGDHLRYLRALADVNTGTIAEALGLEAVSPINMAEVRYKPVEDEALVAALAEYFGRPLAEFEWHNARARKYLTFYVQRALEQKEPITLTLRGGEMLSGQPEWWDLSSIGLQTEAHGLVVVQRHAVVDWPEATVHWWVE